MLSVVYGGVNKLIKSTTLNPSPVALLHHFFLHLRNIRSSTLVSATWYVATCGSCSAKDMRAAPAPLVAFVRSGGNTSNCNVRQQESFTNQILMEGGKRHSMCPNSGLPKSNGWVNSFSS